MNVLSTDEVSLDVSYRRICKTDSMFFDQLLQRIKRQALNEIDAYDICNDAFQESAYFDTCIQVVPNFSNETLVNCMNDLVVSNITMKYDISSILFSICKQLKTLHITNCNPGLSLMYCKAFNLYICFPDEQRSLITRQPEWIE